MCDKNKIRIVFFFKISSDQRLFFRLQIVRVADLTFIFLSHQLLCFVKTYSRDLVYFRKFHFQNGKFMSVVFLQKLDCILKKSGFHFHDIFKSVDIAHLKIKACIFIQMTFGVMFLCTEYRTGLKYAVKNTYHHLFVKLWALCQDGRFVEVAQLEQVCATLCTSSSDLWCVDLGKSFFVEIITECTHQRFLDLEFCTLLHITQSDGTIVQFCLQGSVQFPFVDCQGKWFCR